MPSTRASAFGVRMFLYEEKIQRIWIQSTFENLQLVNVQWGSEIQTTHLLFIQTEKIFQINEALEICTVVQWIYMHVRIRGSFKYEKSSLCRYDTQKTFLK